MKISVLTPTIRKAGLDIVRKSLSKQEFRDFEWLIGSKFDPQISEARWVIDDFKGGFWSLNRIYNKLIKSVRGELIVSWQDWISSKPDTLQKFWDSYITTDKKACLATSGDQYESVDKLGIGKVKIWQDPRRRFDQGSWYEIYPQDLEWNLCAVPTKALVDVGGFCEILDQKGYGMDGFQVNERLDVMGWRFYINHDIESFTIRHNRDDFGGEDNWNKHNNLTNGEYKKTKEEFISKNEWPIMNYLKMPLTTPK